MTKIKICGLTRTEDIDAANTYLPDYIGFVFWPKSKRYVTKEKAKELRKSLNDDIKVVGVFVDEDVDKVAALLNEGVIDLAQLHGHEDEEYIDRLRSLSDKEIIKAFVIHSDKDIEVASRSTADYVLLDAGMGAGETFDWQLLKDFRRSFFLAGGLNASNVEEALMQLDPYAVDVSSGVETAGIKDEVKIEEFINTVRKQNDAQDKEIIAMGIK